MDSGQVGSETLNASQLQALSSQLLLTSFIQYFRRYNGHLSSCEVLHEYFLSGVPPFPKNDKATESRRDRYTVEFW